MCLCHFGHGIGRTLRVTSPQRHRAAQRFNINAATTAGAVVDKQSWKTVAQRVPEAIQPVDVLNLSDAASVVGSIGRLSIGQRAEVEILTINGNVQFFNDAAKRVVAVLPCLLVAKIK